MNVIATHEHFQRIPYLEFLSRLWAERQGTPLPNPSITQGTVEAVVNHGRWLAECPRTWTETVVEREGAEGQFTHEVTRRDGNAVFVSDQSRVYICTICGSPENDGKFYTVVFPRDRAVIETELLKRPRERGAGAPWEARNRNWNVGQTLTEIRAENTLRGIR